MLARAENNAELKDLVNELWVAVFITSEGMVRILAQKAGGASKSYRNMD